MAESEIVMQGVELMLIGMGTVFVFLTLLVFTTAGMSRLIALLPAEEVPVAAQSAPAASSAPTPRTPGNALKAAISTAIHRHRSRDQK